MFYLRSVQNVNSDVSALIFLIWRLRYHNVTRIFSFLPWTTGLLRILNKLCSLQCFYERNMFCTECGRWHLCRTKVKYTRCDRWILQLLYQYCANIWFNGSFSLISALEYQVMQLINNSYLLKFNCILVLVLPFHLHFYAKINW